MKTGLQFKVDIDENEFRVVYTAHFVERYEIGEPPKRPAVKHKVSEKLIEEILRVAIPMIDEIAFGDPDAQGVIKSTKHNLAMVFALRQTGKGFTVALLTMMRTHDYKRRSPQDYEIELNPVRIRFSRDISPLLRDMVVEDLPMKYEELESGITYHLQGEVIEYWIECQDGICYVDAAGWTRDMYEVYVT